VADSGIPSARLKLARAEKHLRALDRAVKKFRRETPYEFVDEFTPNEYNKPDFYIRAVTTEAPPIPDTWAVITGDVLNNARAALDHAIFPHVSANRPGLKPQDIQYPIWDAKANFENQARRFSRSVLKEVRASQPYHNKQPESHPLAALRDLVNIDKHRGLMIVEYAIGEFELAPDHRFEVVNVQLSKDALKVGDTACEAHCRLVKPMKAGPLRVASEIAYGEAILLPGAGRHLGLVPLLKHIVKPIRGLLDRLEVAGC
jgi:hypothetical protein